MKDHPAGLLEFMQDAIPEVPLSDIDEWSERDRRIEDVHVVLVKLDPVVADMSYTEFCDAVLDAGHSPDVFSELVEVYDRPGDRQSVFRVTGERVNDSPRYFVDATSAVLVMHGAFSRDNVAVALYDDDAFEDSAHQYIDAYRLFTPDTHENRAEEIRHANSIIDQIRSGAVADHVDELNEDSNDGLNDYFEEYESDTDSSDSTGSDGVV